MVNNVFLRVITHSIYFHQINWLANSILFFDLVCILFHWTQQATLLFHQGANILCVRVILSWLKNMIMLDSNIVGINISRLVSLDLFAVAADICWSCLMINSLDGLKRDSTVFIFSISSVRFNSFQFGLNFSFSFRTVYQMKSKHYDVMTGGWEI